MDINKFRMISPFYGVNKVKSKKEITVEQARRQFDIYQQYMPNTFEVFINDSKTSILGTMQDVTDLEMRTDTKWMLTSLENKVYSGDVVHWGDKILMCIYDKIKNTDNCYRVKIQPCNTQLNIAAKNNEGKAIVYSAPVIVGVYITDIEDKNKHIPVDMDLFGISIQYNDITKQLKKQSRIYLYDDAYEVVGIDYTNIDFLHEPNKGFLRLMVKASTISTDLDRVDLQVCDYYKIFKKDSPIVQPTAPKNPTDSLIVKANKDYLKYFDSMIVYADANGQEVQFEFIGNNLGCELGNVTANSCVIKSASVSGLIRLKVSLKSNPSQFVYIKKEIKGELK